MHISTRIQNLGESATLAVSRRAKALLADGKGVISFGAGQPDFPTPRHVIEATKKALDDGHTGYALPASGMQFAKQAICQKFNRENDLDYKESQVLVAVGGKEALYLAFMATVNEGDEVIIQAPYWVSYPEQIKLAGGQPVVIAAEEANGFRITPDELLRALSDRTRVVVLNYPSNPSGHSYSRSQLLDLAEVLAGKDILVFSDEIYDRLVYDDQGHASWASLSQETYNKTLTFNALSKSYAMTGWRLGYVGGPSEVINAMAKLQSQTTSGTANFSQHGLVAALAGDQTCVDDMVQSYDERRRLMHEGLLAIPGVTCVKPTGAFYCFPNVSATYSRLGVKGSVDFAEKLLNQAHVAVVPGVAFGCDQHVRLAYAVSADKIRDGLARLRTFLET